MDTTLNLMNRPPGPGESPAAPKEGQTAEATTLEPPCSSDVKLDSVDLRVPSESARGANSDAHVIEVPFAELKQLAQKNQFSRNAHKRTVGVLAVAFVVVLAGAGGVLAWQYHAGETSPMVRSWFGAASPAALAPDARPSEAAPTPPTPELATSPPPELLQRLETLANDLSTLQRSIEQLADKQERIEQNIAKLQAFEQDMKQKQDAFERDIIQKMSSAPVPPVLSSPRKPAKLPLQQRNSQSGPGQAPMAVPPPQMPSGQPSSGQPPSVPPPPPPIVQSPPASGSEPIPRPPGLVREHSQIQ